MDIKTALGVLVALLGLVFYFKRKADKSAGEAIQADTKGQDKILKENQGAVKKQIGEVEGRDDSSLSPEDRAKRWD